MTSGASSVPQKNLDTLAAEFRSEQELSSRSIRDTTVSKFQITSQVPFSNADETEFLDLLEWRVSALLSLSRGGETGLQEGQRSQNCLSNSRAGAPLRQEGVPFLGHFLRGLLFFFVQDTLVLPLIHHHDQRHRHTTEDHHLIGGTPFCSKAHDPFHLHGFKPGGCGGRGREVREGLFPGPCRPHSPCLLCQVQSSWESFVKLRVFVSLLCNIYHILSMVK